MSRATPFPPIGDYAFLSDCEVSALVAPAGSVEWLCLPRPDSPSVFGALLDRSGGSFVLAPASVSVPSQRRYLPGSMVLETTWQTPTGWLLVHDCLVMRRWEGESGPSTIAAHRVTSRPRECWSYSGRTTGRHAWRRPRPVWRCGSPAISNSGSRERGHTATRNWARARARSPPCPRRLRSGHRTNLNRKVDNCVLTLYLQPYG